MNASILCENYAHKHTNIKRFQIALALHVDLVPLKCNSVLLSESLITVNSQIEYAAL